MASPSELATIAAPAPAAPAMEIGAAPAVQQQIPMLIPSIFQFPKKFGLASWLVVLTALVIIANIALGIAASQVVVPQATDANQKPLKPAVHVAHEVLSALTVPLALVAIAASIISMGAAQA